LNDDPTANIDTDEYINAFLEAVGDPNWITSVSPGTWGPFYYATKETPCYAFSHKKFYSYN
jgi:hypothetical protein